MSVCPCYGALHASGGCGSRIRPRLVVTHCDLPRNPPGPVGGGVRDGPAAFPNPSFQSHGVKCLRSMGTRPCCCRKPIWGLQLLSSEAALAPRLTPCLLPIPFPAGRRATAAPSRTTQNWPASCEPRQGSPGDPAPQGWSIQDLSTRSVPVLCLPWDPRRAGSVHYTHRRCGTWVPPETEALFPAGSWGAGKAWSGILVPVGACGTGGNG